MWIDSGMMKWFSVSTKAKRTCEVMLGPKIFKELPNVFGITDDILVVGYDNNGRDHDNTMQIVLLIC